MMTLKLAALMAFATLFMACGGSSPIAAVTEHAGKLVELVESNKEDPKKAEEVVDKYLEDNKDALAKLKTEMKKVEEEMKADPSKLADYAEEAGEMMKLQGKIKALRENAALKPVLAKIRGVLR